MLNKCFQEKGFFWRIACFCVKVPFTQGCFLTSLVGIHQLNVWQGYNLWRCSSVADAWKVFVHVNIMGTMLHEMRSKVLFTNIYWININFFLTSILSACIIKHTKNYEDNSFLLIYSYLVGSIFKWTRFNKRNQYLQSMSTLWF